MKRSNSGRCATSHDSQRHDKAAVRTTTIEEKWFVLEVVAEGPQAASVSYRCAYMFYGVTSCSLGCVLCWGMVIAFTSRTYVGVGSTRQNNLHTPIRR